MKTLFAAVPFSVEEYWHFVTFLEKGAFARLQRCTYRKHFSVFILSNPGLYVTISAITLFQVVVFRVERRESVELTVLCLVYRGSQVLLQKRVKADWQGYALPGGHVEAGESIVDAVIREMQEETGLRIFHPRLCGLKQFPDKSQHYEHSHHYQRKRSYSQNLL